MRKRRRLIIFLLALIGIAALVLYAAIARLGYDTVTLMQSDGMTGTPAGDYQNVSFPSRGQNYAVDAFYLPGYRNTRHSDGELNRANDLRALGYTVLAVDLSYGGGDTVGNGRISMGYSERWDVLGAYDYLLSKGFAPGRIGLVGTSMGAATSLLAAAQEPRIRAIWADSSYSRADLILEEWTQKAGFSPVIVPGAMAWGVLLTGDRIWEAAPIDAASTLAAHQQAVYLIHDEQDSVVPFHHGLDLNAAYRAAGVNVTFWDVPDLDHGTAIIYRHDEYIQRLDSFFKANLSDIK